MFYNFDHKLDNNFRHSVCLFSYSLNWNVQVLLVRLNVSGLEINNEDCSFEQFVVIGQTTHPHICIAHYSNMMNKYGKALPLKYMRKLINSGSMYNIILIDNCVLREKLQQKTKSTSIVLFQLSCGIFFIFRVFSVLCFDERHFLHVQK